MKLVSLAMILQHVVAEVEVLDAPGTEYLWCDAFLLDGVVVMKHEDDTVILGDSAVGWCGSGG